MKCNLVKRFGIDPSQCKLIKFGKLDLGNNQIVLQNGIEKSKDFDTKYVGVQCLYPSNLPVTFTYGVFEGNNQEIEYF